MKTIELKQQWINRVQEYKIALEIINSNVIVKKYSTLNRPFFNDMIDNMDKFDQLDATKRGSKMPETAELMELPIWVLDIATELLRSSTMSTIQSFDFQLKLLNAIGINKDHNKSFQKFVHTILVDPKYGMLKYATGDYFGNQQYCKAITKLATVFEMNIIPKNIFNNAVNSIFLLGEEVEYARLKLEMKKKKEKRIEFIGYTPIYAIETAQYIANAIKQLLFAKQISRKGVSDSYYNRLLIFNAIKTVSCCEVWSNPNIDKDNDDLISSAIKIEEQAHRQRLQDLLIECVK